MPASRPRKPGGPCRWPGGKKYRYRQRRQRFKRLFSKCLTLNYSEREVFMKWIADGAVAVVAFLHFWFLVLEMFLWQKPLGLKTFGMGKKLAKDTAILAKNQGLYNGFLAAGLGWSLVIADPATAFSFQV